MGLARDPLEIAVDGGKGRDVVGASRLEELQAFVIEQSAVLDRIGAGAQRQIDAVGAMRVHGDLLAVEVRGLDDRFRFVLENLRAEAGADEAVHAAGGRHLDDVDAAADLPAHGLAAVIGAVAGGHVAFEDIMKFFAKAEARIHVAGGGGDA